MLTLAVILSLLGLGAATSGETPSAPKLDMARPVSRPAMHDDRIQFGRARKREMELYSKRHYGERRWRLRNPKVIVLHYTAGPSWHSARSLFAASSPNEGELPGVCSHYVVAKDGAIHEIVPPSIRCRHAIGLNYTAIGVEMVQVQDGSSHQTDLDILHRHLQISHAVHLVAYLQQRYGITTKNVIGHAMANDSPYFKDLEGWRNDHTDWQRQDVRRFRELLRAR